MHKRANGTWETKWRAGGRLRSRTFERKQDAAAFDIEVKRAKRLGEVGLLDGGAQTLEELTEDWADIRRAEPGAEDSGDLRGCLGSPRPTAHWGGCGYAMSRLKSLRGYTQTSGAAVSAKRP